MESLDLSSTLFGIQHYLGAHESQRSAPSSPKPVTVPEDRVSLSIFAKVQSQLTATEGESPISPQEGGTSVSPQDASDPAQAGTADVGEESLTTAEQRLVEELRSRDREVRAHERAHLAAAGVFAQGGPSYTYQIGPDGRRYAVGGEIAIDVSEVPGNPRATIQKAMTIRRAALAPALPSGADRAVAAQATQMAIEAQQDMLRESQEARTQDTFEALQSQAQSDTTTDLAPVAAVQVIEDAEPSSATLGEVRATLTLAIALQRYQPAPDKSFPLTTA